MLDPTDQSHAAAVRMRSAAAVAALACPAAMLVVAVVLVVRPCAFEQCRASQTSALRVLAVVAPTLPLVRLAAKSLPASVAVIVGVAASAPLWGVFGRQLAARVIIRARTAHQPPRWATWWKAYAMLCALWLTAAFLVTAVLS